MSAGAVRATLWSARAVAAISPLRASASRVATRTGTVVLGAVRRVRLRHVLIVSGSLALLLVCVDPTSRPGCQHPARRRARHESEMG